jgi:hypothetical protein
MDSQEFNRIIKAAARKGFQAMRMNPNSLTGGFDIIKSDLSIYLDGKQDKDYLVFFTNDHDISHGISVKIKTVDRYFDLLSFW